MALLARKRTVPEDLLIHDCDYAPSIKRHCPKGSPAPAPAPVIDLVSDNDNDDATDDEVDVVVDTRTQAPPCDADVVLATVVPVASAPGSVKGRFKDICVCVCAQARHHQNGEPVKEIAISHFTKLMKQIKQLKSTLLTDAQRQDLELVQMLRKKAMEHQTKMCGYGTKEWNYHGHVSNTLLEKAYDIFNRILRPKSY